jgi:uncharacterized protein (TIGR03118 family)
MEDRALLSTLPDHRGVEAHALAAHAKQAAGYRQIDLVASVPSKGIQAVDFRLIGSSGLAYQGTGPFWITGLGVALTYSISTANVVTTTPPGPEIPGPLPGFGGTPTDVVSNPSSSEFLIPGPAGSVPAEFLFSTTEGSIAGWSPDSTLFPVAAKTVIAQGLTTDFTGLAVGRSGGQDYLYAANELARAGIDVYDSSFHPATLAGDFVDPDLRRGFARGFTPSNIVNVDGQLYVTYTGGYRKGGAVAVFNTDGTFVRQIAANGPTGRLRSPWGVALAPPIFGKYSNDLLVGNSDSGRIDAYNARGKYRGQLTTAGGRPIVINELRALVFGNGQQAGSPDVLYFTGELDNEGDGLLGAIEPVT